MILKDFAADVGTAAAKVAPPVSFVVAKASGFTLSDWVSIAMLAYIAMQAAHLAWKWDAEAKARKVSP